MFLSVTEKVIKNFNTNWIRIVKRIYSTQLFLMKWWKLVFNWLNNCIQRAVKAYPSLRCSCFGEKAVLFLWLRPEVWILIHSHSSCWIYWPNQLFNSAKWLHGWIHSKLAGPKLKIYCFSHSVLWQSNENLDSNLTESITHNIGLKKNTCHSFVLESVHFSGSHAHVEANEKKSLKNLMMIFPVRRWNWDCFHCRGRTWLFGHRNEQLNLILSSRELMIWCESDIEYASKWIMEFQNANIIMRKFKIKRW